MKVLIDNGHGVTTPGKRSPDGRILEYKYCRELARSIHAALRSRGVDAELLVPEDADVSIGQRVARANAQCDLWGRKGVVLVSVHLNASGSGSEWCSASGFSVFCSKNASDSSHRLAAAFTSLAKRKGITGNRSVPERGYCTWSWTSADIGILKSTRCPAVLTENMFQDNRHDVEWLLSDQGRKTLTDLHVEAILEYIHSS